MPPSKKPAPQLDEVRPYLQTLWRGWQKLQMKVQGVRAAQAGGPAPAGRGAIDDPASG